MTNKLRQQILGLFVLFFLGVYLCILCTGHADRWHTMGDTSLRLTLLLGVFWLAWDDLLIIPRKFFIFVPIIILAVVVFRNTAPIVIIILAAVWMVLKFLKFITQPLTPQQRGDPKSK